MKAIKKLLFLVAALAALILITALFVKKDFQVTRTITVNERTDQVFDYIQYLEHQNEYAVWMKKDPAIILDSEGEDGEVGYIAKWESKLEEIGSGEQEITAIEDNERIDFELRFESPQKMSALAYMTTEATSQNNTEVTWTFLGSSPYPFNVMLLFFDAEKTIGPDLEQGLKNLKQILESPE